MIISKKSSQDQNTGDEETSLSSSQRSFKRLQRSADRNPSRSYSRESNASFKNFYIKNVCTQNLNQDQIQKANQISKQMRQRQPTPCKSKKLLSNFSTSFSTKERQRFNKLQKDIAIGQMQQKIGQKNSQLRKISKQLQIKLEHIEKVEKKIKQKQEKITKLGYLNQQANSRILQLEESLLRNQQNLTTTNSTLEKLKKSIQQNRICDLKKESQMLKSKNAQLQNELEKSIKSSNQQSIRIAELEKQNLELKEKLALHLDIRNESMKESYLEAEICRLKTQLQKSRGSFEKEMLELLNKNEEQKVKLKSESRKLMIQLDYIHRKHVEELKLLNKTKAEEISKYKQKYNSLYHEFTRKQKQWESKNQLSKISSGKLFSNSSKIQRKALEHPSCQLQKSILLTVSFQLSSDND